MPLHVGVDYQPLWHELLGHLVPEGVSLVVDLPTGFALWGLDPLPERALVLTFNRHPLYLLDLHERRPLGVLVAPASIGAIRAALSLVARGQRVGSPPTLPFDAPTYRERQVLGLLARGQCPDAIARALGVKPGTVYTYLQNLREKLGAQSQHELVVDYLGHGGPLSN